MRTRIKEVAGVDWFDAAIANCSFEGPRLCDVLHAAGVAGKGDVQPQHVQFACFGKTQDDPREYGGSIPFERAADPSKDVILALKVSSPTPLHKPLAELESYKLLLADERQAPPRTTRLPSQSHRTGLLGSSICQMAGPYHRFGRGVPVLLSAERLQGELP